MTPSPIFTLVIAMWEACTLLGQEFTSFRFSEGHRVDVVLSTLGFLLSGIRCLKFCPYHASLINEWWLIGDSIEGVVLMDLWLHCWINYHPLFEDRTPSLLCKPPFPSF